MRFNFQGLARRRPIRRSDVVDSLGAAVAQRMHVQSLGLGIVSEERGDGLSDVFASSGFALEEKLFGADGDEDDTCGGVQAHVGAGVVVDVFGGGVHPGAEEDGGWIGGGGW